MAAAATAHKDQSDVWWVFLLEGIAAIIFGILLLTSPAQTLVAFVIFLGFYWLFVGVLELVRVFVDRSVPWFWSLLIGILGIVAGLIVLNHPLTAAIVLPTALVVWLGVLGLVIGVFAIIGGFTGGGIGSFIFGVINFIIGLILLGSPMAAALAVPFVFGILLLIEGVALIIWAFRVRS
ncbi:MAG: HdeD family acid-resistance protein [Methyloceanibacter sp.]|uniref:HdeD family acid-resistance protein n=1 Tax=Methyloceanibacter sp. TaxID=1965321 RepID=UPI003D6D8B47